MECVLPLLVIVGVFVAMVVYYYQAQTSSRDRYLQTLELLKENPHDPDLKTQALAFGRQYAHSVRSTAFAFDETAIMNDISAACAQAGSKVRIVSDEKSSVTESRLIELERLREKSLITNEEYEARRRKIIESI
jgi:hypothetical protein